MYELFYSDLISNLKWSLLWKLVSCNCSCLLTTNCKMNLIFQPHSLHRGLEIRIGGCSLILGSLRCFGLWFYSICAYGAYHFLETLNEVSFLSIYFHLEVSLFLIPNSIICHQSHIISLIPLFQFLIWYHCFDLRFHSCGGIQAWLRTCPVT